MGEDLGQVIDDAAARMRFFEKHLGYTPDRDASLEHLKQTYAEHVGELFAKAERKAAATKGDSKSKKIKQQSGRYP